MDEARFNFAMTAIDECLARGLERQARDRIAGLPRELRLRAVHELGSRASLLAVDGRIEELKELRSRVAAGDSAAELGLLGILSESTSAEHVVFEQEFPEVYRSVSCIGPASQ